MIPDFMPVLSRGGHNYPEEGACIMEYVSLIAGEEFSDMPYCVWTPLRIAAIDVNDLIADNGERSRLLVPLMHRFIGTREAITSPEMAQTVMRGLLVASLRWALDKWHPVWEIDHTAKEQFAAITRRIELAACWPVESWYDRTAVIWDDITLNQKYPLLPLLDDRRPVLYASGHLADDGVLSLYSLVKGICAVTLETWWDADADWSDAVTEVCSTSEELAEYLTAMLDKFEQLTGWKPMSQDEIHEALVVVTNQVPQKALVAPVN